MGLCAGTARLCVGAPVAGSLGDVTFRAVPGLATGSVLLLSFQIMSPAGGYISITPGNCTLVGASSISPCTAPRGDIVVTSSPFTAPAATWAFVAASG